MIQAMIFNLEGTLLQTERLEALSYAYALNELTPGQFRETQVIEAFKEGVGLSRRQVANGLLDKFISTSVAEERIEEFGVNTLWQAFVQLCSPYYETLLSDPQVIIKNQWKHNVALLEEAQLSNCKVALAAALNYLKLSTFFPRTCHTQRI